MSRSPELGRLISAAVVNREFCSLLLANPARALASGCNGEHFQLAGEEKELVLSIQVATLEEFAMQVAATSAHKRPNGRSAT